MIENMHFCIKETEMNITVDDSFKDNIADYVREARSSIEDKIRSDPFFGITYDPYSPSDNDDTLIRHMCSASVSADVGPMASVAGAVALHVIERLKDQGCTHAVIDNGGDIALMCDHEIIIRVYSGNDITEDIGMIIPKTDGILGICSSSGKIGHSVSFGNSDVCTVISEDPILSDACATSLGNMISEESDLLASLEKICEVEGVRGCFAFINGAIASCGDLPEFILLEGDDKQ